MLKAALIYLVDAGFVRVFENRRPAALLKLELHIDWGL
jgi:hypothetical protein